MAVVAVEEAPPLRPHLHQQRHAGGAVGVRRSGRLEHDGGLAVHRNGSRPGVGPVVDVGEQLAHRLAVVLPDLAGKADELVLAVDAVGAGVVRHQRVRVEHPLPRGPPARERLASVRQALELLDVLRPRQKELAVRRHQHRGDRCRLGVGREHVDAVPLRRLARRRVLEAVAPPLDRQQVAVDVGDVRSLGRLGREPLRLVADHLHDGAAGRHQQAVLAGLEHHPLAAGERHAGHVMHRASARDAPHLALVGGRVEIAIPLGEVGAVAREPGEHAQPREAAPPAGGVRRGILR